jgi:hypothetical protein
MSSVASRLALLAAEAQKQRAIWLEAHWQPAPADVTKQGVLECIGSLRSMHDAEAAHGKCPLSALRTFDEVASVFLTECTTGALPDETHAVEQRALKRRQLMQTAAAKAQDPVQCIAPWLTALVRPQRGDEESSDPCRAFVRKLAEPAAADVVERLRKFLRSAAGWDTQAMYDVARDYDTDYDPPRTAPDVPGHSAAPVAPVRDGGADTVAEASPPAAGPQPALRGPDETLRSFLTQLEGMLRCHPVWRDTPADGWDAVFLGLEKFVLLRCHGTLFGAHRKSPARDAHVAAWLQSLQFLGFQHLDLPREMPAWLLPVWTVAQAWLGAMDTYLAPADKLSCIMNACRVISTIMTYYHAELRGRDGHMGADDFTPALIYAVLRAAPPRLYSNLRYVGDFARPSVLSSQEGYYFTQLVSAVSFLRHARPDELSLTREEFEAGVRRCGGGEAVHLTGGGSGSGELAQRAARRTRGASAVLGSANAQAASEGAAADAVVAEGGVAAASQRRSGRRSHFNRPLVGAAVLALGSSEAATSGASDGHECCAGSVGGHSRGRFSSDDSDASTSSGWSESEDSDASAEEAASAAVRQGALAATAGSGAENAAVELALASEPLPARSDDAPPAPASVTSDPLNRAVAVGVAKPLPAAADGSSDGTAVPAVCERSDVCDVDRAAPGDVNDGSRPPRRASRASGARRTSQTSRRHSSIAREALNQHAVRESAPVSSAEFRRRLIALGVGTQRSGSVIVTAPYTAFGTYRTFDNPLCAPRAVAEGGPPAKTHAEAPRGAGAALLEDTAALLEAYRQQLQEVQRLFQRLGPQAFVPGTTGMELEYL